MSLLSMKNAQNDSVIYPQVVAFIYTSSSIDYQSVNNIVMHTIIKCNNVDYIGLKNNLNNGHNSHNNEKINV